MRLFKSLARLDAWLVGRMDALAVLLWNVLGIRVVWTLRFLLLAWFVGELAYFLRHLDYFLPNDPRQVAAILVALLYLFILRGLVRIQIAYEVISLCDLSRLNGMLQEWRFKTSVIVTRLIILITGPIFILAICLDENPIGDLSLVFWFLYRWALHPTGPRRKNSKRHLDRASGNYAFGV